MAIIEIFILFILPIILYWLKIVPAKFKFHTLSSICFLTIFLMFLEKWDLNKAGLRIDNLEEALPVYFIASFIGVFAIILSSRFLKLKRMDGWWKNSVFIAGFTVFSIIQEVAWRGFLMPKLEEIIFSATLIIFLNAFLFMLPHVIYSNKKINLTMSFAGGLLFASSYYMFPNLILVSILHMILNFFAILFGFFNFEIQPFSRETISS